MELQSCKFVSELAKRTNQLTAAGKSDRPRGEAPMNTSTQAGDTRISLTLLGPFGLWVDGRYCLPLPRRAQALIALLALSEGHEVAREDAVEMIWGETDPWPPGHGLRQTLELIRHHAGTGLVRLTRGRLSLKRDAVTIDAVEFQALAGSSGRGELTACAALYRGELLENVATVSPRYDEWIAVERLRLAAIAAEAMQRVALSHLDAGEYDAAVAAARRVVALDELRLDAHALLVSILGRCGRRAEALRHSAFCARVLRGTDDAVSSAALLAPYLAQQARGGGRSGASDASLAPAPQPTRGRR
jgi:DNA-binding SARP family transcriptional activator